MIVCDICGNHDSMMKEAPYSYFDGNTRQWGTWDVCTDCQEKIYALKHHPTDKKK